MIPLFNECCRALLRQTLEMGYKSNSPPLDAQCEVKIWPNCQYVSHCTAGFLHIKVRIDSLFRLLITEDTLGVRTGQKTGCSELSPLMKSHDAGIIRAIEQPSKLLIHHRPWHVLQCPESFLPSEWYWARVQSSAITFVVVLLWGFQSELHDSTNQWLGIHLEFKVSLICKKERKEIQNTSLSHTTFELQKGMMNRKEHKLCCLWKAQNLHLSNCPSHGPLVLLNGCENQNAPLSSKTVMQTQRAIWGGKKHVQQHNQYIKKRKKR